MTTFVYNNQALNYLISRDIIDQAFSPQFEQVGDAGMIPMFRIVGSQITEVTGNAGPAEFPWRWTNIPHRDINRGRESMNNVFIGAAKVDGDHGIIFDESFLYAGPYTSKAARRHQIDQADVIVGDGFTRMQVVVTAQRGIYIHEVLWLAQYYKYLKASHQPLNEGKVDRLPG